MLISPSCHCGAPLHQALHTGEAAAPRLRRYWQPSESWRWPCAVKRRRREDGGGSARRTLVHERVAPEGRPVWSGIGHGIAPRQAFALQAGGEIGRLRLEAIAGADGFVLLAQFLDRDAARKAAGGERAERDKGRARHVGRQRVMVSLLSQARGLGYIYKESRLCSCKHRGIPGRAR